MECFCCRPSGQGCRFTRVVMEKCSGYFHIKQNTKENPFEANPEFTIKQIIYTYLSILQAISGSERKTFQSKKLTFTNFYIFITKTNALHFRFEGGRGGSHWDICISHLSDTRDDTLIIPFLSFSSFIPPWECPLEAFFSPSSRQFSILFGRTFNPLKGGGDWQFRVTSLCCILNWKKNSLFWLMTMISVVWALHEYLIPSIGSVICKKKIVSLITYYSKGCRSVAIPPGHSYFWLL